MKDYTKIFTQGQIIKYEVGHVVMHAKVHAVRVMNIDVCIFGKHSNLVLKNCTDFHVIK